MTPTSEPPNIVLAGFMGVGKTAVGREIARRLQRPFFDLDDVIVAEAGMSIPEIFAQHGEAHFRLLEKVALRKLAAQRGLMIATGGGALIDPDNRELMARTSLLVCLSASVSAIEDRIGANAERPLLAAADHRQRIVELMNQRAAAYAEIPYRIDTTGKTVAEVASEVITLAENGLGGVLRLPVSMGDDGYDILIGAGLLKELPSLMRQRQLDGRVAIISDDRVAPLWVRPLLDAFAADHRPATLITVPAGENHKNLATMALIYEQLVGAGLDRSSVIVALGGGVIGDMAGFAAATYLRGISFVQTPTSLLAMVDASVGGKTGVDLPQGKNLVGAFKQPALVLIDPDILSTLPAAEFRNGLGEVIKHGIIADPHLFAQLEGDGPGSIESMIARALRVKISLIQNDPHERGTRAYLNLGHTFGHAIEQVSAYTIPHGQAVALGLIASAHLAHLAGVCPASVPVRIRDVAQHLGLATTLAPTDIDALMAAMKTDKKRQRDHTRFVLPHDIGHIAVHDDVSPEHTQAAWRSILRDA